MTLATLATVADRADDTRRATRRDTARARGYAGIAVYHPKSEVNVGTLWRTAKTYDAAMLATVGRRYVHQSSDTSKAALSLPLHHYADIADLIEHLPHGCPLIGVELDPRATPLSRFQHPRQALYLLGAEDHGLPAEILERCHQLVQIPTPAPWSLNVAIAGGILMHHRHANTGRAS